MYLLKKLITNANMEYIRGKFSDNKFIFTENDSIFIDDDIVEDKCKICRYELSYKERLFVFLIFITIGIVLFLSGVYLLIILNLTGFAICYSLSNIFIMSSTIFLFGLIEQIKNMFKSFYKIVIALILICLIITIFIVAFVWNNIALCILLLILQLSTYCWYLIVSTPNGSDTFYNYISKC